MALAQQQGNLLLGFLHAIGGYRGRDNGLNAGDPHQPLLHAGIWNQDAVSSRFCSLASFCPLRGQHPHYTKRNIADPNHAVERIDRCAKRVSDHGFTQDGHLGVVFDVAIMKETSFGYPPVTYLLKLGRDARNRKCPSLDYPQPLWSGRRKTGDVNETDRVFLP